MSPLAAGEPLADGPPILRLTNLTGRPLRPEGARRPPVDVRRLVGARRNTVTGTSGYLQARRQAVVAVCLNPTQFARLLGVSGVTALCEWPAALHVRVATKAVRAVAEVLGVSALAAAVAALQATHERAARRRAIALRVSRAPLAPLDAAG